MMLFNICLIVAVSVHVWVTRPSFKDPTVSGGYRAYAELLDILIDGVCTTISEICNSRRKALIKKKEYQIRKLSKK